MSTTTTSLSIYLDLHKLPVSIEHRISPSELRMLRDVDVRVIEEHTGDLLVKLTAHVWETQPERVTLESPATWWDHLKLALLDRGGLWSRLCVRFCVAPKMRTHAVQVSALLANVPPVPRDQMHTRVEIFQSRTSGRDLSFSRIDTSMQRRNRHDEVRHPPTDHLR